MNQYREQILQAQRTAAMVNLLKKNNYLTAVGANDVVIDHDNTFVPVIRCWYRVEGFRAKEDEQATKTAVSRAAYGWLRGAHSNCSAFVSNVKCGLDVPDKKCSCGTAYEKDGFGIDAIHMYPLFGGCDINISDGAMELAKECFKDYFREYSEIREIKIQKSEAEEENINKGQLTNVVRYILVPREVAVQYPGETLTLAPEEYFQKFSKFERLMIVEDPQEHSSFKEIENVKMSVVDILNYLKYAVEKKKFKIDYLEKDLNKFASKLSSASFTELLAIEGCLHGTGVWEENGEKLYAEGIPLSELITNREDAYTYLYSKLNGKCCDNPSGQVYEIVKGLQKGIYAGKGMPADLEQLLLENEVPDWYIDSMKKIHYIFPKAHLITYLKRDISNYISTKRNGEALVQKY